MADQEIQQDATTPKKGGFGAFSEQYRDRWAVNHPHANRASEERDSSSTPAPHTPASDSPQPDPEAGR